MTSIHSARQWARILPVSLLAATVLTTVATPAEAVALRSSFAQSTPIFLGDPSAASASNPEAITIPSAGKVTPYPSEIDVTRPVRVTNVEVTLFGLTHSYPRDIEVLLVGPGGQQALLMSHAGAGIGVNKINVVFDDESSAPIPEGGPFVGGRFQPSAYGTPDAFPAPAPALTGNTSLSVFDGTLAAGTWKIYVQDILAPDAGTISGWGLSLATETAPYPSEVSVSGIGSVTDLNVSVNDFTSTYPNDVDLLLVGPQGQQATLMSDVGGGHEVTDVDLTFDDEASADLPADDSTLTTGSYRPTNRVNHLDVYPAPAPAPSGTTALSVFDGTDPNGVWKLFASDTVSGDFSEINGWSLDIEWNDTAGPAGSVSVNAGATTTTSTAVTLTLSATDPAPSTGVKQMRFSNDGTTYSAFQPYATTAAWSLAAGDGAKRVYAQFTDGAGNVSTVTDDITLGSEAIPVDTTGPSAKKFTPRKNATGVKAKASVKVFAVEALAPASVTKGSVVLKKGGSTKIEAKVTYNAARHLITLTPKKPLRKGTYTVKVATTVTDAHGNAWDQKPKPGSQPLTWTFKV